MDQLTSTKLDLQSNAANKLKALIILTHSLVTRINSIRMVLAISALRNLEVHQMDVKTTFLNGDLDEEIYMEQPKGVSALGQENKVCKLVKSLYRI